MEFGGCMEFDETLGKNLVDMLKEKYDIQTWTVPNKYESGIGYYKYVYVPLELISAYSQEFFDILLCNITGGVIKDCDISMEKSCMHYVVRLDTDPGENKFYMLKFRTGTNGIAFKLVEIEDQYGGVIQW